MEASLVKNNNNVHSKIHSSDGTTTIYKDKVVFTTESEVGTIEFGDKKIRTYRVPGMKNQFGNEAWFYLRTDVADMIGMNSRDITDSLKVLLLSYSASPNNLILSNDENVTVQNNNTRPNFTVKMTNKGCERLCTSEIAVRAVSGVLS